MANGILKGLAVAAGTGLAMGFASAKTTGRTRLILEPRRNHYPPDSPSDVPPSQAGPAEPEDEFLNIEPLLDRVERLEERVEALLQAPSPVSGVPSGNYAAALDDLEWRLDENARELALLRDRIEEAERRAAESAASIRRSVDETRAEIPALIERQVEARLDDLRNHFTGEIEQSHHRMLETFEHAIDEKISSRIGSIERTLAEQAEAIEALTIRSAETDTNLQRLVSAIEKLCERAQWMTPPAEQPPQFESHFRDAMGREPVVPVIRREDPAVEAQINASVKAPAFTGGEEVPQKKSRFLFRNLIVAGFSVLASRLFR